MATSKLQRRVSEELSKHFGGYTIRENIRPEWMVDETGQRLELDFFIKELNVAIEVQGAQHFVYTPHFHEDAQGFHEQLKRDRNKNVACEKRGIALYEIIDNISLDETIESIRFWAKMPHDNKYPIMDSTLRHEWSMLNNMIYGSDGRKKKKLRKRQIILYVSAIRKRLDKLVDLVSEHPTLLTSIHPKIAQEFILFIEKAYNKIPQMEEDYFEQTVQHNYLNWAKAHAKKGGILPPFHDYLFWLIENDYPNLSNDVIRYMKRFNYLLT